MATVPSGWAYYDASEKKRLLAGATMPIPAIDDEYFGVTSTGGVDYSKLIYHYNNVRIVEYPYRNDTTPGMETEYTIPAGWAVTNREYTMINADVLSNIAGANVVSVYISERANNLISINLPSTVVAVWIFNSTTMQTVTGTLTSVLKCFNCYGSTALISVPSLIQATNITNGIRMFKNCSSLTTVPALPPNIVSLYECFCNCTSLQSLPSIPSTVMDEGYMCLECTALQQAPINYSTVAKWIEGVFKNCTHLTDASNFTIPNSVVNMSEAFRGCTSLITPPSVIRGTNANAYRLFYDCTSLVTPPTFEGTYSNMNSLFYNCTLLKTAPTIPHGTQTMNWAFGDCSSLEEMPYIPSGIIALSHCFYNCVSLTRIDICLNSQLGSTFSYMFAGCTNLTGTIYLNGTDVAVCDYMFDGITKTIIVCGHEAGVSYLVEQQNNSNVYQEINPTYDNISAVRTDNTGTLDDTGEYMQLSINFTCPVMDHSKIYVPKIYIKNNQIAPYQNWTLTYTNEGTEVVKIIPNSTDISSARIEANDIIEQGNFTTLFSAEDLSEGAALQIFIPTSNSQIAIDWDDTNDQYVISTVYWSGTRGSAIFTGETYIFDATPNGKSFKIGGPIDDSTETGFIVGNAGLPQADQFPSTFNGPVTINGPTVINSSLALENYTHELRTIFDIFYPVGSYYETSDASFDPNDAWGGTWVKDSAGRVTVAQNTSETEFDVVGETGGSKYIQNHAHGFTQPVPKIPKDAITTESTSVAHTHAPDGATYHLATNATAVGRRTIKNGTGTSYSDNIYTEGGAVVRKTATAGMSANATHTHKLPSADYSITNRTTDGAVNGVQTTSHGSMSTGSSGNLQPYVVVIRWHRTA